MRFDQLQKTHKIKAEVTAKRFFCLLTIACNSFMRSSPVLSFSHSLTNPWINNSTKRERLLVTKRPKQKIDVLHKKPICSDKEKLD